MHGLRAFARHAARAGSHLKACSVLHRESSYCDGFWGVCRGTRPGGLADRAGALVDRCLKVEDLLLLLHSSIHPPPFSLEDSERDRGRERERESTGGNSCVHSPGERKRSLRREKAQQRRREPTHCCSLPRAFSRQHLGLFLSGKAQLRFAALHRQLGWAGQRSRRSRACAGDSPLPEASATAF